MKNFTSLVMSGMVFFCLPFAGLSQRDTTKIAHNALVFADSLIKADKFENWPVYADLAPAGVIKHYGGKDGYLDHVRTVRMRTLSMVEEDAPELQPLQFISVDEQWQCTIRVSRYIHNADNKKLHVITYFVAQSKDDGETWRLFDVSINSVANVIYMMPDIFGDLAIKQPSVMTPEEEAAQQQKTAANNQKTGAKKK